MSLQYSIDGGNTWDEIIGSTTNSGTYSWTLPNFIETQSTCKIKVSTTHYADDSDDTFTISAEPNTLTLTSPNGGEVWAEQSTQTITWDYSGDVGNYVSLHYSLDGGSNWTQIIASTDNDGSYSWVLPNLLETNTTCRIKVASTSTSFADTSDTDFSITAEPNYITLTAHNGGEVWPEQSTQTIAWIYGGDVGDDVSIQYTLDGGATWTSIVASTGENKIYSYLLSGVKIARPDHVWSTDITYIRLAVGFLYLMAIMDWYSRFVLAWRLSNTLDTYFCVEALEAVLSISKPEIFNTDQGTQFTSLRFTGILGEAQPPSPFFVLSMTEKRSTILSKSTN